MTLTVLSVGYPLAPVSPDAAGGAEQVLSMLDHALVARGHRSIVVAPEGSRVEGLLISVQAPRGLIDDATADSARTRHRAAVRAALARWPIDVIHMHGLDFHTYLPPPGPPVLATLHLPPSWYPDAALRPSRPDTWLNCVSHAQQRACPPSARMLAPILNGVDVKGLQASYKKRNFALTLGRICPEKGIHLAIQAAAQAEMPLVIAGQIFPYEAHRRYFDDEIRPRLGRFCRFVGPVGFHAKRRLLTAAQCLLIPSLVAETSSLVAREAAASGTATIAFPVGALRDTVQDGLTGFLATTVTEMAGAIRRVDMIDPASCRDTARRRFSRDGMTAAYLDLYERLAMGAAHASGASG